MDKHTPPEPKDPPLHPPAEPTASLSHSPWKIIALGVSASTLILIIVMALASRANFNNAKPTPLPMTPKPSPSPGRIFFTPVPAPPATPATPAASTSPSPRPVGQSQAPPPIDPKTVDINGLVPTGMDYEKSIFLDFDGDGQKEIVLVGRDNNHLAPQQAGPPLGMPLVDVYQFSPARREWRKSAEVNYTNFPQSTNLSTLQDLVILSLGKNGGLVVTYFITGSRANESFLAIVGRNDGTISVYNFPQSLYEARGGKLPHQVDVSADGEVKAWEGIYRGTDANCCPMGGTLESTFRINGDGISLLGVAKQPYNLTF